MYRRALLASLGTATIASAAGCLDDEPVGVPESDPEPDDDTVPPASDDSDPGDSDFDDDGAVTDEPRYDRCDRIVVSYRELPEPLREEADAAIEDRYERPDGGRIHLLDAIDPEITYLRKDGTHYRVERLDDAIELVAEPEPRLPEPRRLTVTNRGDESIELTVRADLSDELFEETFSLEPDDREQTTVTDRFGRYEVQVSTDDGRETTERLDVGPAAFGWEVEVDEEEMFVIQAIAEIPPCPWSE